MATVPRYGTPEVQATNLPNVRLTANAPAPDTSGLQAVAGVLGQIAQAEQEKADTAAKMEVENALAGLENATLHDPERGFLSRQGKDAIGVGQAFEPAWMKGESEILGKAPRHLQSWAAQAAQQRKLAASRILMRHSMQEGQRYYTQQAESLVANAANSAVLNYQDPARVEEEAARGMVAADRLADLTGADDITRKRLRTEAASKVQRAVIQRLATDDPVAALQRLDATRSMLTGEDEAAVMQALAPLAHLQTDEADAKLILSGIQPAQIVQPAGGFSSFDAAVKDVFRVEGGFVANDAGKGPTNFGINVTANPDVDVKNLTQAEAKRLYKARYWDAIGADDLPESIRGIAFDAAVNQGPERAKQWARESGGDLGRFMELRKAHYRQLIRDNPGKFKQYEAGWMARVDRFGRAMGGVASESSQTVAVSPPASKTEALRLVDEAYADNPVKRDRMRDVVAREYAMREAEKTEREGALWDSAYEKINTADPFTPLERVLSPDELALARRENRVETMRNLMQVRAAGTLVQTNPRLFEALHNEAQTDPQKFLNRGRAGILAMADQLAPPDRDRLFGMMEALKADDPSKRADWLTGAERVDAGLRTLGIDKASKPKAEAERGAFRLHYQQIEAAFLQQTGKKPSPEQADQLLRSAVRTWAADPEARMRGASALETFGTGGAVLDGKGQPVTLTEADRQTIRAVLAQRGVTNPTETQILGVAAGYFGSIE